MFTKLLKAKIHRAVVTMTDVDYHGSITIDRSLMCAAGLLANEAVIVADCDNGNRFETYVIPGDEGSGIIGINGAAARLTEKGHRVIVMSFVYVESPQVPRHIAKVVIVDAHNRPTQTLEHPTA